MKILHLLSNWKWTERSEPATDLALAQAQCGAEVLFVCGKTPPGVDRSVRTEAERKGLNNVRTLELRKHLNPFSVMRDLPCLREMIAEFQPDVLHAHMPNAHLTGALARKGKQGPVIVRSCYEPHGPGSDWRTRLLLGRKTDGVVTISSVSKRVVSDHYGSRGVRALVAEPGVDIRRFDPNRSVAVELEDVSFPSEAFVVGLVSRIREARRPDIALKALAILSEEFPAMRLLVVGRGRGNAVEELILKPAKALGLEGKIIVAGYCTEEKLVAAYRHMHVLMYPVPGTDKSCRTVRESLSAGVPVIASGEGFLPELIEEGKTGYIAELSEESFADAARKLARDSILCKEMSASARSTAESRFDPRVQAEKVLEFYKELS